MMSKAVEKSLGGFLNTILGSGIGSSNSSYQNAGLKYTSLGLISFVERLEAAKKISKQEEEELVRQEYQEWIRQASQTNISNDIIADYLCRSLIAHARGHYFTNLLMHAIKLSQDPSLFYKRIGYLYISQTMDPESDLSMLLVNSIIRELSSQHILQITSGLSLIPTICNKDHAFIMANSLSICFRHQQSYVKKRAAIIASIFVSNRRFVDLHCVSLLAPYLINLLGESDPAVAMSATVTLSKVHKYTEDPIAQEELRDHLAKSSSNILCQAVAGSLPKHYNTGPTHAPFVQIQMLRVIRTISSNNWNVPHVVIEAIKAVLSQQWGGRDLTLYMTYLEAINTVTKIPKQNKLIKQSLKIILGFIKSSYADFKYLGIKALSQLSYKVEDSMSESHLEAVLECLYSTESLIQSKTIKLLCSMAIQSNYQAICTTLMDFSRNTKNKMTSEAVISQIASILVRLKVDFSWCVSFLSSSLCCKESKEELHEAFCVVLSGALSTESKEVLETNCNKLFDQLLNLQGLTFHQLKTFSSILRSCMDHHFEIELRVLEKFINECKITKILDQEVIDCLLFCGLNFKNWSAEIEHILVGQYNNSNVYLNCKVDEKLALLRNSAETNRILQKRTSILNGSYKLDLTLSFLDQFVIDHTNNGGELVKKVFSKQHESLVKSIQSEAKTTGFKNPFDSRCSSPVMISGDIDSISSSGSFKSSSFSVISPCNSLRQDRRSNIWTNKGRIKESSGEESNSSVGGEGLDVSLIKPVQINSCVEIAHEAIDESLSADLEAESVSLSFIETQKAELTKAFLKGFRFSK